MNCPHCNKEITEISAYFELWQRIDIENEVVRDSEPIFDDLKDAECRDCGKSIKEHIDEKTYEILMKAI